MTETNTLQVGDRYTIMKSGLIWRGEVRTRGDVLTVDAQDLDNPDRLSLITDEARQVARWGEQVFAPEAVEIERWTYGSPDWEVAHAKARAEAYALPTEAERHAAFQAMHRRFGPPPVTSRSHAAMETSFDRAYEEQQQRLNNPSTVYSNNSITTVPDESKPQTVRPNRTVLR